MGIILFQLSSLAHGYVKIFNSVTLGHEILSLVLILLLNAIVMFYFSKEERLLIGVKKFFMIYGLQIFIFLRRLLRILYTSISKVSKIDFEKDVLIINNELTFFFFEVLFVLN